MSDVARPATASGELERESPTYYGQPAIKEPVWIWSVPAYLFAGGAAAGAATLAGVAQAVDRDGLDWLVTRGRWVATGGSLLGTAFLIHDLGRPSRFLNMLRVFRPTSAMNMGSWTLATFGGAATTSVLAPLALGDRWGRRLGDVGGLGAALLGPVLGTYTGVLLSDTAVPVWTAARRELPLLFGASGMAGATDALDLLAPDEIGERVTRRASIIAKTAEMGAVRGLERTVDAEPEVGRALHDGVAGDMWRAAKVLTSSSLAVSLLPVPPGLRRVRRIASAVLGLVGGVLMRFAIVRTGTASARDPLATFVPQRRRLAS